MLTIKCLKRTLPKTKGFQFYEILTGHFVFKQFSQEKFIIEKQHVVFSLHQKCRCDEFDVAAVTATQHF